MSYTKTSLFFLLFIIISSSIVYLKGSNSISCALEDGATWEAYYHSQVWKSKGFPMTYYPDINVLMLYFVKMHEYFGPNPLPYYVAEIIMHLLATIGVYMVVFFSTGEKIAAWIAGLLFASLGVGFQINYMPADQFKFLFPLILFGIQLYLFLKSRTRRDPIIFIFSLVLYFCIIYISPQRYPFIIFIIVLDILWFLKNVNVKNMLFFLYRFGGVFLISCLAFNSGPYHAGAGGVGRVIKRICSGEWDILISDLTDVGFLFEYHFFRFFDDSFPINTLWIFAVFMGINYTFKRISHARLLPFIISSVSGFLFIVLAMYISGNYTSLFPHLQPGHIGQLEQNSYNLVKGGLFLIFVITFAVYFWNTLLCDTAVFCLFWIIVPMLITDTMYYRMSVSNISRHQVLPYAGFCVFTGLLFVVILKNFSFCRSFPGEFREKILHHVKHTAAPILCSLILLAVLIKNVSEDFYSQASVERERLSPEETKHFNSIMQQLAGHHYKEYSLVLIQSRERFSSAIYENLQYTLPIYAGRAIHTSPEIRKGVIGFNEYRKLVDEIRNYYSPDKYEGFNLNNIRSFKIEFSTDDEYTYMYDTSLQIREKLQIDLPDIFGMPGDVKEVPNASL